MTRGKNNDIDRNDTATKCHILNENKETKKQQTKRHT